MFKHFITLALAFVCASTMLYAQDTLTVVTYNILQYPDPNAADNRHTQFGDIMQHLEADIIMIQELKSDQGADDLLNLGLNTNGITSYSRAPLYFLDGGDLGNMLFYNSDKLGFIGQTQITTTSRDPSHYRLYVKEPGLACGNDTTFIEVIGLHLKAGNDSNPSNPATREIQATDLMAYINALPADANVIVGGDFNVYDDEEDAYQTLVDPMNTMPLQDTEGDWDHAIFADALMYTQSTRSWDYPGGNGGSTGGIDDRFDMILMNTNVLNGLNGVTYLNNSYVPFGNDGYHFNDALIDPTVSVPSGTLNNLISDAMAQNLFDMSDHLPVVIEVVVDHGECDVELAIKNLLEGPLNAATGLMESDLLSLNLLPTTQPFNRPPWNYAGTETASSFPADVIDWVLVELRDENDPNTVLHTKAGLLLADGAITDADGINDGILFPVSTADNFYITIKSRGHMAVISSNAVNTALPFDFSTAATTAMGSNPLKPIGIQWTSFAGDHDSDGEIEPGDDYNEYLPQTSELFQYLDWDLNYDGKITVKDYNLYRANLGTLGTVEIQY